MLSQVTLATGCIECKVVSVFGDTHCLRTDSPNLLINNEVFHRYLTEGVDVEVRRDDGIRGDKVYLVDFDNPDNNEFLALNQFTIIENNNNRRPDIILFVNGLPLVLIELKNATDENATVYTAFKQLQTYKAQIPSLFVYNALLIISDGWDARAGTMTSPYSRFMAWKTEDGVNLADDSALKMETMTNGMLRPSVLLDLIRHFIVFEKREEKTAKKVAAYHQYYAVNKALIKTVEASAITGDRRAGVVWHTQGSGKSLSMVFYSGKVVLALDNPTIVVITDRNDLDDQLFETFDACGQILRQRPRQAEDRRHLRELLSVASGGIVFTTIQKFMPFDPNGQNIAEASEELSGRRNIVVIADEAHRSQYDFIDGYAKHLRDALPNASFIGFTGTPIESSDRNTQAVFGEYVDVYDIQQAVIDKATIPIYYESRLAKINFDEAEKEHLDEGFEEITEGEELTKRQQFKAKWARLEAIVGNENRLEKIAEDLVRHFETRSGVLEGKGLIVAMSRRICVDLYNQIVKIRPEWHSEDDADGIIKVIMTGNATDNADWQQHIRNKPRRKAIGERLKDENDKLKLVIVRDMWLTGFDILHPAKTKRFA